MTSYIYSREGKPVGLVEGRFVYDMGGHAVGQISGTHVHKLSGQYVGELIGQRIIKKIVPYQGHLSNPGKPGNRGTPIVPSNRPSSAGYPDAATDLFNNKNNNEISIGRVLLRIWTTSPD